MKVLTSVLINIYSEIIKIKKMFFDDDAHYAWYKKDHKEMGFC